MQEVYWKARNGQLGIAHRNRANEEVDFRPARYVSEQFGRIMAVPPRGQKHGIDQLWLDPEETEVAVIRNNYPHPGVQEVVTIFRTHFAGQLIVFWGDRHQTWGDEAAKAASDAARETRQQERETRKRKAENFIKTFPAEEIACRVSRSTADRVRFGAISAEAVFNKIVTAAGRMAFGIDFSSDFWRVVERTAYERRAEVKAAIIAVNDQRRAEKKAAWMRK